MASRRTVLKGLGSYLAYGGTAFSGYAFGVEPMWRLRVQPYRITPTGWPANLRLRATVIADLHAGAPQMSVARIKQIVARANDLEPDVHLLLGDYAAGHKWITQPVHSDEWSAALGALVAPLGVHAVLGNHDWWDDYTAQAMGRGPVVGRKALERNGIPVYENDAVRLTKDGQPFWLAGLGDQLALFPRRRRLDLYPDADATLLGRSAVSASDIPNLPAPAKVMMGQRRIVGVDDLTATLAKITDDAPVILMAHEPDIFPQVPARVAVTLSGHTHGGQVRFLGYSPVVPSRYGRRYAYGHVIESREQIGLGLARQQPRHLVVSGGLGCSIMPVRFGVPPEIVLLDIGAAEA